MEGEKVEQTESDFTLEGLKYQHGMSGGQTECLEGAIPPVQNNP